jgi:phosphotransferase system IIB component
VEAIAFGKSCSSRLRETVDDFIDMDENPREFLIGVRGGSRLKRQIRQIVGTDTDNEPELT